MQCFDCPWRICQISIFSNLPPPPQGGTWLLGALQNETWPGRKNSMPFPQNSMFFFAKFCTVIEILRKEHNLQKRGKHDFQEKYRSLESAEIFFSLGHFNQHTSCSGQHASSLQLYQNQQSWFMTFQDIFSEIMIFYPNPSETNDIFPQKRKSVV